VLFDLAAPIALYYGLRAAGAGIVPSLAAGTVPPAGSAIVQAIRHRRIDALAVTVLTLLVLSAGVSVLAGSPRFLLAKDAVLTAVWGTWFLLSLLAAGHSRFGSRGPCSKGIGSSTHAPESGPRRPSGPGMSCGNSSRDFAGCGR
jgi:intracellular septation protein A